MEYTIEDIDKIKIGDSLVLDIDAITGTFPDEYATAIKDKNDILKAEMKAYVFLKDLKIRLLFKDKDFKKIGIVTDNLKLEKMKMELFKNGFKCLEIKPYLGDTTAITFDVPKEEFQKSREQIHAITTLVEAHFKRRN